jgi:hypothetical protein
VTARCAVASVGLAIVAMAGCRSTHMRSVIDVQGGLGSSRAPSPLRLELVLPPHVRTATPVRIRLRIQNTGQHAIDLYLRGRAVTFDVVIARPGGEVVWRRLEREIVPAIVHLRPLRPGERLEAETVWHQKTGTGQAVEPGEYVAHALLLVEGEPLRTPSKPLRILAQ